MMTTRRPPQSAYVAMAETWDEITSGLARARALTCERCRATLTEDDRVIAFIATGLCRVCYDRTMAEIAERDRGA